MIYFTLSMLLSLVLSGALLALLIRRLKTNWDRKNRFPISFLAPIALTAIFLILTVYVTLPRVLDTIHMIEKSYVIEEVKIDSDSIGWSTLEVDGKLYYFNQWRYHPETGKTYRLSFTPNSRFIVFMDEVVETTMEGN